MPTAKCDLLKDSILSYLSERTTSERIRDLCVVTIPIPTIDGRFVDVFVESRATDFYLVHDAGKAANELILNGIDITPAIDRMCSRLAENFGVNWSDDMFQAGCKAAGLNPAILAVASCSSFATIHLLGHVAKEQDEHVLVDQFGAALKGWVRSRAGRVKAQVPATGAWKQHCFDFVVFPKSGSPIGVNIVSPGGNPAAAADRAAFRSKDLESTPWGSWRKVSVQAHAETWSAPASGLLRKCSDVVIELNSGDKPSQAMIAEKFGGLIAA